MRFDNLGDWLRDGLLPTVLIVLGVVLLARAVQWVSRSDRAQLDADVRRRVVEGGRVVSESVKRSCVVVQAAARALVSLTYFVAAVLAVRQLGVPLTTLIAPATVVGVAIGFGVEQVVGDLLAGFFPFTERQFGIGDLIRLSTPGETRGVTGTVEELTLRVHETTHELGRGDRRTERCAPPGDEPVEGLVACRARHPGAR